MRGRPRSRQNGNGGSLFLTASPICRGQDGEMIVIILRTRLLGHFKPMMSGGSKLSCQHGGPREPPRTDTSPQRGVVGNGPGAQPCQPSIWHYILVIYYTYGKYEELGFHPSALAAGTPNSPRFPPTHLALTLSPCSTSLPGQVVGPDIRPK